MDLQTLQQQLNNKTLDLRNFNGPGAPITNDQRTALDELINRGELIAPPGGIAALEADIDIGSRELVKEVAETQGLSGIRTPVGTFMSERESFELVGDLIGSFTPYLMNRDAITKDITQGVTNESGDIERFTKPTGKQAFKLEKLAKVTTGFADSLAKVPVLGKATKVGKLFNKTVAGIETLAKRAAQVGSAEYAALKTGDAAQSAMRAGLRTEAASLGAGALGAGAGSLTYDLAMFNRNLFTNTQLDLADVTEDDLSQTSFVNRMKVHAQAAMVNSIGFGLAGTVAGSAMARGFKYGKKQLFGLGTDEAVKNARLAFELGVPISPVQAATGEGLSFFAKNFFQIFGVTPYTAKPGRKMLLENYRNFLFPASAALGGRMIRTPGNALQPSATYAMIYGQSSLGAEGANILGELYKLNRTIINDNHDLLLREAETMGNPAIVPTTFLNKELAQIKAAMKGDNTNNIFEAYRRGELRGGLTKSEKDAINRGILMETDNFTDVNFITMQDHALFKKVLLDLSENAKTPELAEQAANLRKAMDDDFSSIETLNIDDTLLQQGGFQNFVNRQKGATQADKIANAKDQLKKIKGSVIEANKVYDTFLSDYRNAASTLMEKDGILGAKLYTEGFSVSPQRTFNRIIQLATRGVEDKGGNIDSVNSLKRLLGVGEKGPKGEYAEEFLKKIATRHVYDAFNSSFKSGFSPIAEELGSKNEAIRKILSQSKYGNMYSRRLTDPNANFVDADLFNKIQTGKIEKADADEIQKVLRNSETEMDFSNLDPTDFDIETFKQKLGLNTAEGKQAAEGLFGKEHVKNMEELFKILEISGFVGVTDPSTFLTRRAGLVGLGGLISVGGVAGFGAMQGGQYGTEGSIIGGLMPTLLTVMALRGYGKAIADPNTTKALLGLK